MLFLAKWHRVLLIGTAVSSSIRGTAASPFGAAVRTLPELDECPLVAMCCDEDCCGQGTSWDQDSLYCILDLTSEGFNGSYTESWMPGCIERVCCNADCCSSGTTYEEDTASCVSSLLTAAPTKQPSGDSCKNDGDCDIENGEECQLDENGRLACMVPIKGSIDDDCIENGDCVSKNCFYGICVCNPDTNRGCEADLLCFDHFSPDCLFPSGTPCDQIIPTCVCNVETGAGCTGDFICGNVYNATGRNGVLPGCYLPVGASCQHDSELCLTGSCDQATNVCTCNIRTSFPCDTEGGEECRPDENGRLTCMVPIAGSIGSACSSHGDCETEYCSSYSFCHFESCTYGTCPTCSRYQICSCNPDTNEGCDEDLVCSSCKGDPVCSSYFSSFLECRLPFGAPCDGKSSHCATRYCDRATNLCTCNPASTFKRKINHFCEAKSDESCLMGDTGSFACIVPSNGSMGSSCDDDSQCHTGKCGPFVGKKNPKRTCICNVETGAGCSGDFVCGNVNDAIGTTDSLPGCYLPVGASCQQESNLCLTASCNKLTNLCTCNMHTDYPCDTEGGEECRPDKNGSLMCMVPIKGSIGDNCVDNQDCESNNCFYNDIHDNSACACNPDTNEGCEEGLICNNPYFPQCKLPIGAPCDGDSSRCVTSYCDRVTSLCTCHPRFDFIFPFCDTERGEKCVMDDTGSFACIVPSNGSIGASCDNDSQCKSGKCAALYSDEQPTCICNVETGAGCTGDFICGSEPDIEYGPVSLCHLPVGSSCQQGDSSLCLRNCDKVTNLCTCDTFSSYPCDTEGGEVCTFDKNDKVYCKLLTDGSVGTKCTVNDDCDSGVCYKRGFAYAMLIPMKGARKVLYARVSAEAKVNESACYLLGHPAMDLVPIVQPPIATMLPIRVAALHIMALTFHVT